MFDISSSAQVAGVFFLPLVYIYYSREKASSIRKDILEISDKKEILLDDEVHLTLEKAIQGIEYTKKMNERLIYLSNLYVILRKIKHDMDKDTDILVKSIQFGLLSPMVIFIYLYYINDVNLSQSPFAVYINLILLGVIVYSLIQYSNGLTAISVVRKMEQKKNYLDECKVFVDLEKFLKNYEMEMKKKNE